MRLWELPGMPLQIILFCCENWVEVEFADYFLFCLKYAVGWWTLLELLAITCGLNTNIFMLPVPNDQFWAPADFNFEGCGSRNLLVHSGAEVKKNRSLQNEMECLSVFRIWPSTPSNICLPAQEVHAKAVKTAWSCIFQHEHMAGNSHGQDKLKSSLIFSICTLPLIVLLGT